VSKRGPGDGSGREALIRATISVVAAKGLRGLTFRAVADAAGVNNSLIAHYFGSRDALIEEALDWTIQQSIIDSHLFAFAKSKKAYVANLLNMLQSEPEQEIFQYEMLLESRRRPDLAPKVLELYARFSRTLLDALRVAQGTAFNEDRAVYTFAALDGLVLQGVAGADPAVIERAVGQLWDDVMSQAGNDERAL
jgi:AcrR family transcriptional regulator